MQYRQLGGSGFVMWDWKFEVGGLGLEFEVLGGAGFVLRRAGIRSSQLGG